MELAGEAEKLAKQLHPRDEEAAERHAIDAFLGALERPLVAEVQKLVCRTMEDVVAAERRIEKILEEQNDSKMEQLILSMQDQIRILTKDLKSAHEQMAAQQASTTPTAALAASPAAMVAVAQPPPLAQPPSMAVAHPPPVAQPPLMAAAQPQPLATAQPPPYPSAATYIRIMQRKAHIFGDHADSRIGALPAAFHAAKRATLCPTALLAPSSSAFCASKHENPPAVLPEDKSWNYPPADDSQGSPQTHLNY